MVKNDKRINDDVYFSHPALPVLFIKTRTSRLSHLTIQICKCIQQKSFCPLCSFVPDISSNVLNRTTVYEESEMGINLCSVLLEIDDKCKGLWLK